MRTAFLSDIHGHLPALECVLRDIEHREIDRLFCLGDVVDGGADNEEIVTWLQTQAIPTVRGNHDEYHDCRLDVETEAWLRALPEQLIEDDVCYVHITPRERGRSIRHAYEAWNVFDACDHRLIFIGHLHAPALYTAREAPVGQAHTHDVDEGVVTLDPEDRYIISFGAIGYPRRGGAFIRYGIYDDEQQQLEYIKLEGPQLPFGLLAW